MKTIAFKVLSSRIHDIELNDGTTIETLTKILSNGGYDVDGAAVIINRAGSGKKLTGEVGGYELQDGDTVEFYKRTVDTPALDEAFKKAAVAEACAKACNVPTCKVSITETSDSIQINIKK